MLETKTNLQPETVKKVNDLVSINVDSRKGFEEAAKVVDDVDLKMLFNDMAQQRRKFAEELSRYVVASDEAVEDDGSALGTAHRWWLDIRGKLSSGGSHAVLAEAERGEDAIKAAYESALKKTPGSAVNDVLQRQFTEVKKAHDRIRDLRDAAKGEAPNPAKR